MDTGQTLPDSRSRNEQVVYLPPACHFCITGYDAYTGLCSRPRHRSSVLFYLCQGKAFFDDKGTGQVQWPCSHTGQVIDGTTDTEFAYIATGKVRWGHNESIRRKSQIRTAYGKDGGIIAGKLRIGKMGFKYAVDQLGRLSAAGPVSQRNHIIHRIFPPYV